ncbi:ARCA-like protein [Fusarium napiforme]|uniref:ARCA-like protein n=1 Tax=Fusarium napiforme TaxID=42672 RepID=A0A8H5IGG3_9HYPO|nr:ARCA-like protein [Fusarium napiforme]
MPRTSLEILETSLSSDTALYPVTSSSVGPQALTLTREQTSVQSPIDNDHAYHNPNKNPLSINELLCSEISCTLPDGDCATPPFVVKPDSLYLDRPTGQAIDHRAVELLLHFKTVIAKPWFEVTDPDFTNEALRRAPRCPLLLYSLLAVSSSHKSRFLDDPDIAQDYARYGEEYHEKCISLLLPMLNDNESITDGGFTSARTSSMRSLTRGYLEPTSTDWESIVVARPQTKQFGPNEYSALRLRSLNTVLDKNDRQSSIMKPLKLASRIGTVRNHKPSRQSFTKSVIRHREYRFPPFLCFWIVVVSDSPKDAPAATLTTCSIWFESLLFRHAHDARPRSSYTENWYSVSRTPEGNENKNITFLEVTVWSRFFKSSAACQRDDVLGPLAVWWWHFLENYVYVVPEPPSRTRTKPMEVLCVGLPRSATESLQTALLKLGYDHTYHGWDIVYETPNYASKWIRLCRKKWFGSLDGNTTITQEEFDEILGHSVAVTDAAASVFAAELIAAYPDAKVVLNYRKDLDA